MNKDKDNIIKALIAERIIITNFKHYLKIFLVENNVQMEVESVFVLFSLESLKGYGQKELANLLGYDPATMGRVIDKLSSLEYITKSKDEDDARKNILVVTQKGIALINKIADQTTYWFRTYIKPKIKDFNLEDSSAIEKMREIAKLLRKDDVHEKQWWK